LERNNWVQPRPKFISSRKPTYTLFTDGGVRVFAWICA